MVIPFIYNLFKRHPGCMVMIQRPPRGSEEEESSGMSPVDGHRARLKLSRSIQAR